MDSEFDELEFEEFEEQQDFQDENLFESDDEAADFEDSEAEEVFSELEEMEFAGEFLSVSTEHEMEQFIGKLIQRAGRKIGRFARSSTGKALGGILKKTARFALPVLGTAAGTVIGGPVGGAVGGGLVSAAGRVFGLELEGLSPEDKEFEVARRFIRFSGGAVRKAALMPKNVPADQAAASAVTVAARRHAPGLLAPGIVSIPSVSWSRKGRWIRRGATIILLGV